MTMDPWRIEQIGRVVMWLQEQGRCRLSRTWSRRTIHNAMVMVLREPTARPQVLAGLTSPNPAIRRGCYAALLHGANPDEWGVWGLEATDPWIRLHAARAIRELPPDRVPTGFVDRMATCGPRPVRQLAVEMIAEKGDVARLRGFLLDQSPTLREFARFPGGCGLSSTARPGLLVIGNECWS